VLVDIDCLSTLDKRQVSNGLAEAVKMSLTSNAELFEYFEGLDGEIGAEEMEKIVVEAVKIKRGVVEADEREGGLRRILNFGHTLGHGIEAASKMSELYHGECVALGMLPVSAPRVRERLIKVLKKLNLPTAYDGDIDEAIRLVAHDKKRTAGGVKVILVPKVGEFEIREMSESEFCAMVKEVF
jgi:3-dehydroquinate synthase